MPYMSGRVLMTGGAGFLGSPRVDELLPAGYEVRGLDYLPAQGHGPADRPPAYRSLETEFLNGGVRDSDVVRRAPEFERRGPTP